MKGYHQDSGVRIDSDILQDLLDRTKPEATILIRLPDGSVGHLNNHMLSCDSRELILYVEY